MCKDILNEAHSNKFPVPNDMYYGTSFAPRWAGKLCRNSLKIDIPNVIG